MVSSLGSVVILRTVYRASGLASVFSGSGVCSFSFLGAVFRVTKVCILGSGLGYVVLLVAVFREFGSVFILGAIFKGSGLGIWGFGLVSEFILWSVLVS